MKTLPPIHPGEILAEDFMKPIGLSQYRVAKDIGVIPCASVKLSVENVRLVPIRH